VPEWAAGALVGVITLLGGGIFSQLLKMNRTLGELTSTIKAHADLLDDLQTWRLNIEQRKASTPGVWRRDIP
jgi:hypothetical protein